ncbi:MAG: choice-of-anchor D domain-containing protein, partial [Myxococcales bacterium]|nr:choice-of-anchor D domain-containing protein [Myxococcales bacterium]
QVTERPLTITNVGGSALSWSATLTATPYFSLSAPTGGSIAPGGAVTMTVTAQPVPSFAAAGSTEQSTLRMTTSDPAHSLVEIPATLTAGGGALGLVPSTAAFGRVPVGMRANDIPIALVNSGNLPLTVGFIQPADSQFDLAWTGAPSSVVLAPGASVPGLFAQYQPTRGTANYVVASINTTGNVCGTNPTSIALTGQGTSGSAIVQPAALDFGGVACGAQAGGKAIAIQNAGGASFDWTASFARGGLYGLSASSGTVAAGATTTVLVTPSPVPATSATTPDLYAETLTITTTAYSDAPHTVTLHETAQGAVLSSSASAVRFGGVAVGMNAEQQLTISNAGNVSAAVSLRTGPPFDVVPRDQVVGGAGSSPAQLSFTPGYSGEFTGTATLSVSPDTVLCGPLPSAIVLAGTGVGSGVAVSPTNFDFGLVACGAQAAARTLTVENNGGAAFNWMASVTSGPGYYSLDVTSGWLAAGSSTTLTITPAAIPSTSDVTPDVYAGTITMTTDLPGDAPHAVSLHETAQGAILSLTPASVGSGIPFGPVSVGSMAGVPFGIANGGNAPASVTVSVVDAQDFQAIPGTATVAGGSTSAVTAVFMPQSVQSFSDSLSLSTNDVLCAPVPTGIPLDGSGQ